MSSKPTKRQPTGGRGDKKESSAKQQIDDKNSVNDDEYEKGKSNRGGARGELNADRKAVEDLDKWGES